MIFVIESKYLHAEDEWEPICVYLTREKAVQKMQEYDNANRDFKRRVVAYVPADSAQQQSEKP